MDPTQWAKTEALGQVENAFALGRGNAHTALSADIHPKKNGNKPQKRPTGFSQHLAVLSTVFESTEVLCTTLREMIAARQAGKTSGKGSALYVTIADMQAAIDWFEEQEAIPTVLERREAGVTPTGPGHIRDDSLDRDEHGDGPDNQARYSPIPPPG